MTFDAIEVTSSWAGKATNCAGAGFTDPPNQPDHRLQERPTFSGWKKKG